MWVDEFKEFDDEKLVELLRKSNHTAYSEIYNRYWSRLYYTVSNVLDDKEIAGDIVQEIFTNLWLRRKESNINSISAYLYGCAKRAALQNLRNGKVAQKHINRVVGIQFANDTEEQLNLSELKKTLEKGLNELPSKCREVFELSRFEGLSHIEIALRMNISRKTVANHINKALKHLRITVGEFIPLLLIVLH